MSPTPSASESDWSGLDNDGQLSSLSSIPSPSESLVCSCGDIRVAWSIVPVVPVDVVPVTGPFGVRSHSSPIVSPSESFWSGLGWKQLSFETSTPSASLSTISPVVDDVDPTGGVVVAVDKGCKVEAEVSHH
jgi:hypothetical protein